MIEYNYDIDMTPGRTPLEINVKQFDTDFTIVFALQSRLGGLTLESGTVARIRGTKADGYGYSVDATLDVDAKTVTVQGDEQMTPVAGRQPFELTLVKDEEILNTATFYLNVYGAALSDDSIISDSDLSDFREALTAADTAIAAAETATTAAETATTAAATATTVAATATTAAETAQQAAENAAAVFQIAGDTSFVVLENGRVRMYYTEEA